MHNAAVINMPDLSPIFNNNQLCRLATFIVDKTDANSIRKDIYGHLKRPARNNSIDGMEVQNAAPTFFSSRENLDGVTNKSQLEIHFGSILKENGESILDESNAEIIAVGEYVYNVIDYHLHADNYYELILSED